MQNAQMSKRKITTHMVVMVLFFVTEVDPAIIVKDVQDGALGLAPFLHTKRIGTKTVVTGILWHST